MLPNPIRAFTVVANPHTVIGVWSLKHFLRGARFFITLCFHCVLTDEWGVAPFATCGRCLETSDVTIRRRETHPLR